MNDIKTGQPMSTDEEIKAEVKELINDVTARVLGGAISETTLIPLIDTIHNLYTDKYGI